MTLRTQAHARFAHLHFPLSLFAVPTVSTICTNGLASTAGCHLHHAQLRKEHGHTPEVHCADLYTLLSLFQEANPV